MTLAAKTIGLVAAIVVVALAAVGGVLLTDSLRALRENVRKGLDGQAQAAAYGIEAFVAEGIAQVDAAARELPAGALAAGRTGEIEAHLGKAMRLFPRFQNGLFLLAADGAFVADFPSHPELRGRSFAHREYFRRTLAEGRGIVGLPYRSQRTGKPVLTFTAPIRNRSGAVTHVLAASVDLLSPMALGGYRRQRYGETGYLYVVDRSRLLVLHPDDARILTEVAAGKNALLEQGILGVARTGDTVNSVGVPMVLAMRPIPGTSWVLGAQVPSAEAYAGVDGMRRRVLVTSAAALLLALVLVAVAVRAVSRPLRQLGDAADLLGRGLADPPPAAAALGARKALDALSRAGSGDEVGRLAATLRDLEERLSSTVGSLRRSAEDWQRTFDAVREAVLTLDAQGRVVRINQAAVRWFGVTEAAAAGWRPEAVLGLSDDAVEWPSVEELLRLPGKRWSASLERAAGTFELSLAPIASEGVVTGAVLVVEDVTERRRVEQEALRVDKLESLGVLAGGIAHDFNNLLAAMLGNLSLARAEAAPGTETAEVLAEAEEAARRARALTLQLLTFSKGGAPIKTRVALGELVRASADFALRGAGVACEYHLEAGLWDVEADPGQLSQVVHNLVLNAAQAMPRGGTIEIGAENLPPRPDGHGLEGRRRVRVRIRDEGTGIAREQQHRIFDPYFTTKPNGNGLGLASVHSIVRRHGGTIEVESRGSEGTTFTIVLEAAAGAALPSAPPLPHPAPGSGRVLVMDDDPAVRATAGRMLEELGYRPVLARDGDEAVALFTRAREGADPFDAVILDLTVRGGTGGLEAIRRIRAEAPDVRALVSSGYSKDPVMADHARHGFGGVMPKPYGLEELADALGRLLSAPQPAREVS